MALGTSLKKEFLNIVGGDCVMTNRQTYSFDSAVLPHRTPALMVAPANQKQLRKAIKLAHDSDILITVNGSGTSLSGGVISELGDSIVILTNRLNSIIEISETVYTIVAAPILPCTLKILDKNCLKYIEAHTKAGLPVEAATILLIEVDCSHAQSIEENVVLVIDLCKKCGTNDVRIARNAKENYKIWKARRNALHVPARAIRTIGHRKRNNIISINPDMGSSFTNMYDTAKGYVISK